MVDVKRGEIWLVNLDPTIGHEIKKMRPAVIIQNDVGNRYSSLTIIAPLTSQKFEKVYPFEVSLPVSISKLEKDSKVLLNHIRAVDKMRLVKKISSLDQDIMHQVNEAIKLSLGLDWD